MDSREFIQKIQRVKEEMRRNRPAETLVIANDALALIKLRIQTSGESAAGSPYEGYTSIYAKYGRRAKGYQDDYVDFTRTGNMFKSIRPEVIENTVDRTVVEIKARDRESQTKLNGQFRKRGNILEPSESEIRMVNEANRDRIDKYLRQIF